MNPGDEVTVVMVSNHIFPWQTAPSFKAIFQAGPSGPGDTYRVTIDTVGDQTTLHLNGNSSEFVGIYMWPSDG